MAPQGPASATQIRVLQRIEFGYMKIAMIGQKGIPAKYGGVEHHVHGLSTHLVKHGHEVTVYARPWYARTHKDYDFDGVHIKHLKSIKTKHLDTITHTFLATIDAITHRYDVIHYHGIGPSLLSWIPRLFSPNTKVVTTFHSIDRYHEKWSWLAKLILRLGERTACSFAHETISVSKSLQQYCIREFQTETVYIPNAVSISEGESPSIVTTGRLSSEQHIKHFGLEKNKYLLMVSRLVKHKGAHLLVQAFVHLKQKYPEKLRDIKLAIVGGSVYTNEYVRSLHRYASACNDIVFTDFQSGDVLTELYKNAKALIHPSLNEGLPVTVLQAMNYGIPVLVSDIAEHLEIVKDVRLVFNENSIGAIENAIMNFFGLDEATVAEITQQHKQVIERNYSWEWIVPQIIEVYEKKPATLKTAEVQI